ncbi:T9SS type A sorting domain-containing protein, partial [Maribellus sp. YY47]|uniref:T9SS type A sorting domain-containing protein n=1 Tax=Maribellus sp. YY47 TaxID=2929486 RepID=UPI0020006568
YPAVAGVGTHLLTYTLTDANGCTGETTASIVLNSIPQPEILNTELSFCEDSDPVLIEAIPDGGVLSGTGVSGTYFYPAVAGVGTHLLTYTLTDANGCTGETTASIVVNSIPQPEILNTELSFCEDSDPVLIEAIPEGGVLSGTGVSGTYFYPAVAGAGTHTLTYTFSGDNGCKTEMAEKEIFVYKSIEVDLGPDRTIGIEDSITLSITDLNCSVLWFDGTTKASYTIKASTLGVGDHPIWVTVSNDASCFSSDTLMLTIDNLNTIIDKKSLSKILIYPNPTQNGFTVKLNENERLDELYLFGTTGEYLLKCIAPTNSYFDISFLASGVYFLTIKTNLRITQMCLLKL